MVLNPGDKLHVITRRAFEADLRRHFVGEIEASSDVIARVNGFAFVFDATRNEYVKRPEPRLKIVPVADSGAVITMIPQRVELSALRYELVNKRLVVTDGKDFSLDINEFGAGR